ncbi:MAG: hypothetical protein ACK5MQ_17075 [Pikeienuella sp.]
MTEFAAYQRAHLLRERDALARRPPPSATHDIRAFHPADGEPGRLGETVLRALTIINLHIETCPPRMEDRFDDAARESSDAFWRPKLPAPLSERLAREEPDVDPGIDWAAMSGKEIAARVRKLDKSGALGDPSLFFWLMGFTLEERYWFYAGHEIRDGRLRIGVEMSEDAGVHALNELVGLCGGRPAEGVSALTMPKWLSGLFGRNRSGETP